MRAMLLSRAAIAAQVASGGNLAAAGVFSTPTPTPAARASLARRTNPLRLQPSRVAWARRTVGVVKVTASEADVAPAADAAPKKKKKKKKVKAVSADADTDAGVVEAEAAPAPVEAAAEPVKKKKKKKLSAEAPAAESAPVMAEIEAVTTPEVALKLTEMEAAAPEAGKKEKKEKKQKKEKKAVPTPSVLASDKTAVESAMGEGHKHEWTRAGRPVARETMRYHDLLTAIRKKEVKELVMAQQGVDRVLVVFNSGDVRLVQLPSDDTAVADMMSVHGVPAVIAKPEPLPATNTLLRDAANYWLPSALILAVYGVVMYRTRKKGDWDDRVKLRKLDAENAKKAKAKKQLEEAQDLAKDIVKQTIDSGSLDMSGEGSEEDEEAYDAYAEAKSFMSTNAQKFEDDDRKKVTFDDVAGIGDAKVELLEVVDFFKKPEKYRASGSRIPKGILLCGPPGTGKTLLARAVAGESGVSFFSMTASEFVEMFVGVGAARVRDLFAKARKAAPAIVFIDELDAVGRKRGGGGGGNDERDQTLNQMLSELDGFSDKQSIVVMAATNRPDVLDPALIRPGRFDRKVVIGPPDALGREEILKVHAASKPMDPDVDLKEIAFSTTGFTGAALANIINLAALVAAKDLRKVITMQDLFSALELETMGKLADTGAGPERRRRMAVHEAAKAILAELLPSLETVELVTIVPREKQPDGQLRLEFNEQRTRCGTFTRQYLHDQVVALLGSRAAEALTYGMEEMSTVNASALDRARQIAAKMVATAGMSDDPALNKRTTVLPQDADNYLGNATMQFQFASVSMATEERVHAAVASELESAYKEAKDTLEKHQGLLNDVVEALTTGSGTLSGEELRSMMVAAGAEPQSQAVLPDLTQASLN